MARISIWWNIENIHTELINNANISAIFDDWSDINLYIWLPASEFANKTYWYLEIISDTALTESDNYWNLRKVWRLSITIVWSTQDTSDAELFDFVDIIAEELTTQGCDWLFNFNWFKVSAIQEDVQSSILTNTKNRPQVTKDFLFYYNT